MKGQASLYLLLFALLTACSPGEESSNDVNKTSIAIVGVGVPESGGEDRPSTSELLMTAVGSGAELIRLDVQMTKDGQLVVNGMEDMSMCSKCTTGIGTMMYEDLVVCAVNGSGSSTAGELDAVIDELEPHGRSYLIDCHFFQGPLDPIRRELFRERLIAILDGHGIVDKTLVRCSDLDLLSELNAAKGGELRCLLDCMGSEKDLANAVQLSAYGISIPAAEVGSVAPEAIRQGLHVLMEDVDSAAELEIGRKLGVDMVESKDPRVLQTGQH